MTHDSRSPGHGRTDFKFRSCEGLPDIDDVMRQLSNFLVVPVLCRRRACRQAERCPGGPGPPCLHEYPDVFAVHVRDGLREMRLFWQRQRAMAAQRDGKGQE
jgi:hypothetical protein